MTTVSAPDRSTQLAMHALGAALATAATHPPVSLDLGGVLDLPGAGRARAVEERIRATMTALETAIRAQQTAPDADPPAVLGRRLVENGESYDAVGGTYTCGPGFDVFVQALCVDADARDSH